MNNKSTDRVGPKLGPSPSEIQITEDAKEVTVSWSNHQQTLVDGLWQALVDRDKVDVEVGGEGRPLPAHQLVLGIFCPGLRERLLTVASSPDLPRLPCQVDANDLALLVEFVYKGRVTIPNDRLATVKAAARDIGLQAMENALEQIGCPEGEQAVAPRKSSTATLGARKRKGRPVKISGSAPKRYAACDNDDIAVNAEWDKLQEKVTSNGRKRDGRTRGGRSRSKTKEDMDEATKAEVRGEEAAGEKNTAAARSSAKSRRWLLKQPQLQCPHCSYRTRDKRTYRSHLAKHDPSAERFACDVCCKTFRNQTSFRRHVRGHSHPEKLFKCSECEFRTPQKSTWIQHLAAIHRTDPEGRWLAPDVRCALCNFACFTEYQLKAHVAQKHAAVKPHKCPECEYAAIAKGHVDKHVRMMHRNERPYMCETCGFRSKTSSAFNMHVRSHTGVKPYACGVCGQAYTRGDKLKAHLLKHARGDGKFACHACGQLCDTRDEFAAHLKYDHPAGGSGAPPPPPTPLEQAPQPGYDRTSPPASFASPINLLEVQTALDWGRCNDDDAQDTFDD